MDNLDKEKNEALPDGGNPQADTQDVYTPEQRERHLQQLEGSKKEAERKESLLVETYKDLASQDASQLDKLYEKDPRLADKVAKEFEYDSYEDLKASMNPGKESNPGFGEKDFEKMYTERRAKEIHEESTKKAEGILSKLDEASREKAKSYFDIITEGKSLTPERATEFAEMATLYVNKDKIQSGNKEDIISMMASSGISSKSNTKPKEDGYIIDTKRGELILDSNDE